MRAGLGLAGVVGLIGLSLACAMRDDSAEAAAAFAQPAPQAEGTAPPSAAAGEYGVNPRLLRRFKPSRAVMAAEGETILPARVELGRWLFHEPRISRDGSVSCSSCHALNRYGVDGLPTSRGYKGQRGARNAPTVYHAAGNFQQFWDGRAASIEDQALGPILNPIEMAAPDAESVVRTLAAMPEYVRSFAEAFPVDPQPLSFANVGRAIGAFERNLTTRSRWDDYLEGKADALSAKEVKGLREFTNLGCMVCHTGELLGASMFEKAGVVEAWPNQADQGRFQVTHQPGDRMMFKVPTLRNVAQTAPYFHDGSVPTLDGAVSVMAKHQLGLELSPAEIDAIVAWLGSLTGTLPERYLQPPTLPPNAGAALEPPAGSASAKTASLGQ
jgi:cytochrome c peroxidase